jgi:hypothetical protein
VLSADIERVVNVVLTLLVKVTVRGTRYVSLSTVPDIALICLVRTDMLTSSEGDESKDSETASIFDSSSTTIAADDVIVMILQHVVVSDVFVSRASSMVISVPYTLRVVQYMS